MTSSEVNDEIRQHVEAARHQALAEAVQIAKTVRENAWATVRADPSNAAAWDEMVGAVRVENALQAHAEPDASERRPEPAPRPFCNTWPFSSSDRVHKARGCCDGWLPHPTASDRSEAAPDA
jgi:hypothetical protein